MLAIEQAMNFSQEASHRMRTKYPDIRTSADLLHHLYGRFDPYAALHIEPDPNIWVTDRPEQVFPYRKVYTVTSIDAVDNLKNGIPIVPKYTHEMFGIRTHRGFSIELMELFLKHLNVNYGFNSANSLFVYAGTQIDPEQVWIEDRISKRREEIDELLVKYFYGDEVNAIANINPNLERIFLLLRDRQKPGEDPKHAQFIDEFMNMLTIASGVREGWYTLLKDTLYGNQPNAVSRAIESAILSYNHRFSMVGSRRFPPMEHHRRGSVILEIDVPTHIDSYIGKPYPLVVGTRNPEQILTAAYFDRTAITAIYSSDPEQITGLGGIRIAHTRELHDDAFINQIRPESITRVDPVTPLCAVRYTGKPASQIWGDHVVRRNITPLFDIPLPDDRNLAALEELTLRIGKGNVFGTAELQSEKYNIYGQLYANRRTWSIPLFPGLLKH